MQYDRNLTNEELPLACSLTTSEQAARGEEVADLFKHIQQTEELADGYALKFPGNEAWASRLTQFIAFERECCPFFTFALIFEPQQGPIWLHLRGPEGVKEFIEGMVTPQA